MKFKTTLILLAVFIAILAVVLFVEKKDPSEDGEEGKLVSLSSDEVEKIVYKKGEETFTFQKDKNGEWLIIQPLEAKADRYEVNRLSDDFSDLEFERVVEEEPADLEKYGIPSNEITLYFKEKDLPVRILIGMENPLDNTFFAQKEGETRVVLLSSSLKSLLEKGVFDFRQKDIFQFKTDEVKSITLKAQEIRWQAQKTEEEWFLQKPIEALAEKSDIDSLLSSLSSLKAKKFVSEEKKEEDIKKHGLESPDYEIALTLPIENQELKFSLHKTEDKVLATTSLSSKIIEVEDTILTDLEKGVEELRKKDVVDFYSWEANKLYIKRGDLTLALAKIEEEDEEKWYFEQPEDEEADKSMVETFIRKIEGLEAKEFIDPPLKLEDYGLDNPQAEVKIWVKENDGEIKEYTVLVGNEIELEAEKEKEQLDEAAEEETEEEKEIEKQVIVKNARLAYLFKVDPSFLEEFPKDSKDWIKEEKEEEKN